MPTDPASLLVACALLAFIAVGCTTSAPELPPDAAPPTELPTAVATAVAAEPYQEPTDRPVAA